MCAEARKALEIINAVNAIARGTDCRYGVVLFTDSHPLPEIWLSLFDLVQFQQVMPGSIRGIGAQYGIAALPIKINMAE